VFPVRRGDEIPFSPRELIPVLERLRLAVDVDLKRPGASRQRVAQAWHRVGELRLPGTIAPQIVLDEVERLVNLWDRHRGPGGINRAAFELDDARCAHEASRIEWMLHETERAAGLRE